MKSRQMHHALYVFLFISVHAWAQSASTRMGARPAGLGDIGFILKDESSLFQNVGALGFIDGPSTFFAYETVPELTGANRTAAAVMVPILGGTLAAGAYRFGDDIYNEQFITAGFGHRLTDTSLGLRVNMLQYRADGFGTRTAFTVDVAGLTQLTPEWSVGAGIFNINQASIAAGEKLPVSFVAAICWQAGDGPLLALETEKTLNTALRVRGGIELNIHKKLLVRAGFSLQPITLSAGIGWKTQRLKLDFATQYHQVIGFYYQASAGVKLLKRRSS